MVDDAAPPSWARSRVLARPRLRSSLLLKSIAAVVAALVASTVVTSIVLAGITRSALATQSRQLGRGQSSILQEAFAERERTLNLNLRNLAQILNSRGLFAPENWVELTAQLGRASANLELDLLSVLDEQGHELVPAAGVGKSLAEPEAVLVGLPEARSRLLQASDSTFVQVTAIEATSLDAGRILVGGYAFADQFAYSLRRQIGSLDDVVLVAADQVAGSTLTSRLASPPAPPGTGLPTSPTRVDRRDFHGSVAYVPVGSARDANLSAIGLVLHDPGAPLKGSLGRMRLATTVVIALVTLGLAWLLFRCFIRPLVRLAGTAGRVAAGDLTATFGSAAPDEIGMLARSLERMRIELQSKLDLIARQADDLQRQATELQETSQRIVAAEDNERHRLARDLHDGIQQQLVVLRMRVGMATDRAEASAGVVDEFEQLGLELDATIERLREVTRNLYPSILLDRGLAVATRSYIRQLPTHVHLESRPDPFPRLAPEVESGAYFLLCEALTNAFKHAAATEIRITLAVDGERLLVTVEDDGRGFVVGEGPDHGGLLHMHDRVRSFGGGLEIVSAPGLGTKVLATFPNRPAVGGVVGMQPAGAPPEPAAAG